MDTHFQVVQQHRRLYTFHVGLFPDKASDKLIRIEPADNPSWKMTYIVFVSHYFARRVFDRIALYKKASQPIKNLLSDPDSCKHGGKLSKQAVDRKFHAGGVKFKPTIKLSIKVGRLDNEADGYFYTLAVRAAKGSPQVPQPVPTYFKDERFCGFCLAFTQDCTVLFQMTVNSDHGHRVSQLVDGLP